MARKSQRLSTVEAEVLQHKFTEHRLVYDEAQINFIADYFEKTWPVDLTHESWAKAFPLLKPHLRFYSDNEWNAIQAVLDNPAIAPDFEAWFQRQNILAKERAEGNENIALLLNELRGRQVTTETVMQAIGRLQHRGANLHFTIKKPVYVDPRRHKATDDGKPFLGCKDSVNIPLWKKLSEERRRQDAERERLAGQRSEPDAVRQARFKDIAEGILGNTHSQSDQIRRVLVTDSSNQIDWERTAAARKQLADSFSNRSIR